MDTKPTAQTNPPEPPGAYPAASAPADFAAPAGAALRVRRGPIQPANKLDRRIVRVWHIHEGIALVIIVLIAVAIVGGMYVGGAFASSPTVALWVSVAAGLFTLAQLVMTIAEPPIRYARWRYEVTNTDVVLRHGIIVVKTVVIPLVRVQHVETKQGPILKSCGLSSVTISTAGESFEIPGLGSSEAERLRDQVSVLARIAQEDV